MPRRASGRGPLVDLDALAVRLPPHPVTRFAPSPTGLLHLGHLVNAIYVWGIARALGGRVLLRLENHDLDRARPEHERALLDDLDWLGFTPDAPATRELRTGAPSAGRQMDRPERYQDALAHLTAQGLTYWCDCSRQMVRAESGTPEGELRYDGRCRGRGLGPGGHRGVRVRLPDGEERFEDARLGAQAQSPVTQCGDLLVRDRRGYWTYQFAVTVDDLQDNVNLVVRGTDLLPSTARQIVLARMLGREQPAVFLHHPLIISPSGEKLSKSHGDVGLSALRAARVPAEEAIGRAAAAAGLLEAPRAISAADVVSLFR